MLETSRSFRYRPSEWVKWTTENGAFHNKRDMFSFGPVWIFAPTAQRNWSIYHKTDVFDYGHVCIFAPTAFLTTCPKPT